MLDEMVSKYRSQDKEVRNGKKWVMRYALVRQNWFLSRYTSGRKKGGAR